MGVGAAVVLIAVALGICLWVAVWLWRARPGTLAQIATVIAENDGNIDNISMKRRSPDFTDCTIDLEVYDLKHLNAIISQLRAKKVVAAAERVTG